MEIINQLKSRNISDFLPLVSLEQDKLVEVVSSENKNGNNYRIYIFSDKFKVCNESRFEVS